MIGGESSTQVSRTRPHTDPAPAQSETNYDQQVTLWLLAIDKIALDVLESVPFRTSHHDRSFPRRYQYLMEELQTYSLDVSAHKAQVLNVIEAEVRQLFLSGVAFGLKEHNKN